MMGTSTFAAEVKCWDGDCLKNGWSWLSGSTAQEYACYRDGCQQSGWIVGGGQRSYTQCKAGGCFTEGWYQVSLDTQVLEREIVCKSESNQQSGSPSCLKYGWTAYSPQEGQLFTTMCWKNDCEKAGWTVQFKDLRLIQAACKKEGCFKQGWREN